MKQDLTIQKADGSQSESGGSDVTTLIDETYTQVLALLPDPNDENGNKLKEIIDQLKETVISNNNLKSSSEGKIIFKWMCL